MKYKLEYIFLCREDLEEDYNFPDNFLSLIPAFKGYENDCLLFEVDGNIKKISYTANKYNETTYHLNMIYETKNINRDIDILSAINKFIVHHSKDKGKFYIIQSNDYISQYYCNKAYPFLNGFEREFRNLLYKILTKVYSSKWIKTIPDDTLDSVKKKEGMKNAEIQITNLLYELDMGQIIDYVCVKRRINIDDTIDNKLSSEQLSSLKKSDIIIQIAKLREKSIMEYFLEGNIDTADMENKLKKLPSYRNKIAHTKFFSKKDYEEFTSIIKELNPQIRKMSGEIDTIQFKEEILDSFTEANDMFENIGRLVTVAGIYSLKKFSDWYDSNKTKSINKTEQSQLYNSNTSLAKLNREIDEIVKTKKESNISRMIREEKLKIKNAKT